MTISSPRVALAWSLAVITLVSALAYWAPDFLPAWRVLNGVTLPKPEPQSTTSNESVPGQPSPPGSESPVAVTPNNQGHVSPPSLAAEADSVNRSLISLAKSRNYKKTYEDAKSAPQAGGFFVARLIGQRCDQTHDIVDKSLMTASGLPHIVASRVQDAGQRLQLLCSGLISSDLDLQADLGNLLVSPDRRKDPILALESRYVAAIAAGDREKTLLALTSIVSAQTPDLFLNSLLPAKDGGIYFDGVIYQLGSSGSGVLLDAAKLLVACSVWGRCGGQEDYYVLRNCALMGSCSESYNEQVRQILGDEERVARAKLIAASMSAAILSKDLARFVP